jgi:hypothetical protein
MMEFTSGDVANAPSGLHVTAKCQTSGRSPRTRSTTAMLSGLFPERARETSTVASSMYRSVLSSKSVEGTAMERDHAAATADAA